MRKYVAAVALVHTFLTGCASLTCEDTATCAPADAAADGVLEAATDGQVDVIIVPHGDASSQDAHLVDVVMFDSGVVDSAAPGCEGGTIECGGACVDPTSTTHCGTCTNSCGGPEAGSGYAACHAGTCGIVCDGDASTTLLCGSACVDPLDVAHCGSCTTSCTAPSNATAMCSAGDASPACGFTCNTGFHICSGACQPNTDEPSDTTDPCIVSDAFGVFVSPSGTDSPSCGSMAAPCKTITAGAAKAAGKRVYVCSTGGSFPENLSVDASLDGLAIFGGLDCGTWSYTGVAATVAPASGPALVVNGLTTGLLIEDLELEAASAPAVAAAAAGSSSIAVVVNGSTGVVFRRVTAVAGTGQPGGLGAPGQNSFTGTAATGNGAQGGTGGAMQSCACSTGGQGGAAGIVNGSLQIVTPAVAGGSGQQGSPNGGSAASPPAGCNPGGAGSAGGSGPAGNGGQGVGALSFPGGWSNASVGAAGTPGTPGQGGGGGGGDYYVQGSPPTNAGGGGGCGGCGGAAGLGGFQGGSSMAVVAIASAMMLDTCTLTAAAGGVGGAGGAGQPGQQPGSGGPASGSATTCSGGAGGAGGAGGGGGGGPGGHSIAIAYHGSLPTKVGTVTETTAAAASGGGSGASQGSTGLAAHEQSF